MVVEGWPLETVMAKVTALAHTERAAAAGASRGAAD